MSRGSQQAYYSSQQQQQRPSSGGGAPPVDPPVNSVAPAISTDGTPTTGETITCSDGTWSGSPTYTYQWKRAGSSIGGETTNGHTLVTADEGKAITCVVTATNAGGAVAATSDTVTPPNMAYAAAVLADTPAGYWRLGEASGATAADASGNARHGTINGTVTYGVAGALTGNTAISATFSSANNVAIPVAAIVATGANWSIEGWMKFTGTASNQLVYTEGRLSTITPFAGFGCDSGHTLGWIRNDANTLRTLTSTALFNDNLWHHVVVTRDGSALKLYTDGVEVATGATLSTFTLDNAYIGVRRYTTYANAYTSGAVDEVAVYPSTLTPTRILAHFNARS